MTEETLDQAVTSQENETASTRAGDKVGTGNTETAPVDDQVKAPEFAELAKKQVGAGTSAADINRLHDVKVAVSAELGRTNVPIQDLLKLTEGSVLELNRSIDSPIELIAQGLPLANGEVVVVDDKFAIRIQEIYDNPS